MKLRWSKRALADLNRFAVFLQDRHPAMARRIGPEILKRAQLIADYPDLGRLIGQGAYRELSCPILACDLCFSLLPQWQRSPDTSRLPQPRATRASLIQ